MFQNKNNKGFNRQNDRNAQQKKIERIKKYYAKMNEDEEKVKKYVREKTIEWLSQSDKTRFQIEEKIFKNIQEQHTQLVSDILDEYEERGYLSEERFVENFIRNKHEMGYGETKIKNELKLKGVKAAEYTEVFEEYDFFESAKDYIERKTEGKEHTEKEIDKLQRKLISRGFSFAQIAPFMTKIKRKELIVEDGNVDLSDTIKFVEKRMRKGYGLQKIRQEVRQKGYLFNDEMYEDLDFFEAAKEYKLKKYGTGNPEEYKDLNKRKQHMLSRGFSFEEITYAMEE